MSPVWMKWLVLLVITLQTTALVLALRHSRTASDRHYLASTAVLLSEVVKLAAAIVAIYTENGFSLELAARVVGREVVGKPQDTLRMAVPSFLYTIQNNLQYVALTNLDAATFQVLYQLKILTTALMSVWMLRRRLLPHQWASLVVLVAGVCLVQLPSAEDSAATSGADAQPGSRLLGVTAVLASSLSSGYSGVYFERIVKTQSSPAASLSVRNLQLSLFSVPFGVTAVVLNDGAAVAGGGFFQGYTRYTWMVIALQAFGGLAVSVAMKYADNVLKGFATSISILLSALLSTFWLHDTPHSWPLAGGAALVVAATITYGYQPTARRQRTD